MTENAIDTAQVPAKFVRIQFKGEGPIGTCPVDALPVWEKRGYTAVSDDEVEAAKAATTLFDPAADGVTAAQVHAHLSAIDSSTPEGKAEYDRVVAAEQAGENRKTAFPS